MLLQSQMRQPEKPWEFRHYLTDSGRNDMEKWDANLSKRGRANRDTAMRYLRNQPIERWTRPEASSIGDHLYVIHFKDENGSAHRLCGFFDLDYHAFVICVTIIEKDGKYKPKDYEKSTIQARANVAGVFEQRTASCTWGCDL
ncbi:MAG: hypothetical protein Q7T87_12765 [Polaromonas sp.]|nr:hypothetical protein [Polaromonas sp.]